jgi:hypothetical protein
LSQKLYGDARGAVTVGLNEGVEKGMAMIGAGIGGNLGGPPGALIGAGVGIIVGNLKAVQDGNKSAVNNAFDASINVANTATDINTGQKSLAGMFSPSAEPTSVEKFNETFYGQ